MILCENVDRVDVEVEVILSSLFTFSGLLIYKFKLNRVCKMLYYTFTINSYVRDMYFAVMLSFIFKRGV